MPYSWLNFVTARQQLALRLADPNMIFWTDAELRTYIVKALRMFNSLTWCWKQDFVFNNGQLWNSLGALTGSPRLRTVTDTQSYVNLEYMLLEPASGGTWTGTSQFTIQDLAQALQRRRDEMLQVSNCNQSLMTGIPLTPGTRRTVLPDTVIDVERVRYIFPTTIAAAIGFGQLGYGGPPGFGGDPATVITLAITLYRDDTVAQEFYEAGFWQAPPGFPNTFMLSSEPPLFWDVDIPPLLPGTYEAVVLQSGTPFNPPTATLLGIPDDFAWVLELGALADLLGRESEATDRERASYALQRYQDGLILMKKAPWILLGKVDGQAVSIDAIEEMDRYSPEWDSNPNGFGPVIVEGGIDFMASPVGHSTGLTVLGNAPVPVLDNDPVQVSRSNWDCVLDLAQSIACFKMGGGEWRAALELEKRAIQFCAAENSRLKSLGNFTDILYQRGLQQERDVNRYNDAAEGKKRDYQRSHPEYF